MTNSQMWLYVIKLLDTAGLQTITWALLMFLVMQCLLGKFKTYILIRSLITILILLRAKIALNLMDIEILNIKLNCFRLRTFVCYV